MAKFTAVNFKVIPGDLTSQERDAFLIWNTEDDFDSDVEEYRPIMRYHRMVAFSNGKGHWYLPFVSESARYKTFNTEREAFDFASQL